jgi:hypothetical protein
MSESLKWWFNPKLYTTEEISKMNEWADKIDNWEMSLEDVPMKYREAINCALNSN